MTDPDTRRHLRKVGLVLSVLGVIAILIPQFVTLAVEVLLAWLLIAAGAAGLLLSWGARGLLGWWYTSITFLLTLVLGLLIGLNLLTTGVSILSIASMSRVSDK